MANYKGSQLKRYYSKMDSNVLIELRLNLISRLESESSIIEKENLRDCLYFVKDALKVRKIYTA